MDPQPTDVETIADAIEKDGRQGVDVPEEELTCSLYISRAAGVCQEQPILSKNRLEKAIESTGPTGPWNVSETVCGLIAAFGRELDAEKLLQHGDLAIIFEGPVQVARFSARDTRYRQAVLLRDVPWAIPLQDLSSALARQGIAAGSVERSRQYVRVEILDVTHYEQLLRQGLDFFGAARFSAIPERWWRNGSGGGPPLGPGSLGVASCNNPIGMDAPNSQQAGDCVLQCYRCQGFWHVAANCRHLPRCVRCGEAHSVEFCPRPRNSPVCCHCSGSHHAGYRQCPVRLQLLNATPVSITLSANRINSSTTGQYPLNKPNVTTASQGQLSLKSNNST